MTVTVDVTTSPISVTVEEAPIVISSDESPPLAGNSGYAPDPSGQPDDKWLRTVSGAYVFTDAPSGTANPSDAAPQPVGASPIAGVSTGLSRADHVHEGAAIGHNHDGAYAASGHNHDAVYLSPAEVIAGDNVAVDLATTPGSVIISASGADDHAHAAYVPATRSIGAGAGLTGGGSLASDRSVAVGAGTGIEVNADDVAINRAVVDAWYAASGHNHSDLPSPVQITNPDRTENALIINRTDPAQSQTDPDIMQIQYLGTRRTWTNEKGMLRVGGVGTDARDEDTLKIITDNNPGANAIVVVRDNGDPVWRVGALGRVNYYFGSRLVGDTMQIRDATEADQSTIEQETGGDLVITPANDVVMPTTHGNLPLMPVWTGSQAALDGLTQQAGILYLVTE